MTEGYNPAEIESRWWKYWFDEKLYGENLDGPLPKKKFVMVIPPPNVTGVLHIGHALACAMEDALTRWHRLQGHLTVWIPGCDHAGIATQTVVENQLYRNEKLTRYDLGREKFISRVWNWKEEHGNHIVYQMKRFGISVDWSREYFTMDKSMSKAVTEAFVQLYDRKLIFRDHRLVAWCPYLNTALSDIEVDAFQIDSPTWMKLPDGTSVEVGVMSYFKYPLFDDPSVSITVATTRLETMLGDVAVAVHPEDKRYQHLIGKRLRHPFFPEEREMYIIADDSVDPNLGTGAVKITPAHDKNDFEVGKRHGLKMIDVLNKTGTINDNGGAYKNLHRFACRAQIKSDLTALNLFEKTEPHAMFIPRCSRSGDIVEYLIIPQWWLDCKEAAKQAHQAVVDKKLTLIPAYQEAIWAHWLTNIKDWCISRQLWWGHQIPAYRIVTSTTEEWVVGRNEEEAREKAQRLLGSTNFTLERDEDVLDTWFSSALVPFSALGWPEKTKSLDTLFPTTLLETGYDILFFWVARMVMMSLLLMNSLPFETVLMHPIIRDAHGRKMSKSLGNVVDPVDVIDGITLSNMEKKLEKGNLPEKELKKAIQGLRKDFSKGIPECGSDALRFGLINYTTQRDDINLDINRIVGYRHFCNKLFNACRFASTKSLPEYIYQCEPLIPTEFEDIWILNCLKRTYDTVVSQMEEHSLGLVTSLLYNFWYNELCSVYLELFKQKNPIARNDCQVLYTCMYIGFILLHPFMPFITEELYHRLIFKGQQDFPKSISLVNLPDTAQKTINTLSFSESADETMKEILDIVHSFRAFFAHLGLQVKSNSIVHAYLLMPLVKSQKIEGHSKLICAMTKLKSVNFSKPTSISQMFHYRTEFDIEMYLRIEDQVSLNALEKFLNQKLKAVDKELTNVSNSKNSKSNKATDSKPKAPTTGPPQITLDKIQAQKEQYHALYEQLQKIKMTGG